MNEILLVEDDDTLGLSLEVALSSQGHNVHWCQSIGEANGTFGRKPPDLVLLDLGLPDGSGVASPRDKRR